MWCQEEGAKNQRERNRGSFCPHHRGWVEEEHQMRRPDWSQRTLCGTDAAEGCISAWVGTYFWTVPHAQDPLGKSVATEHTSQAGEGRQQLFCLLPEVSGQLASPPTMLCIYPTSKARAAIKGRKRKEMKLTLHSASAPILYNKVFPQMVMSPESYLHLMSSVCLLHTAGGPFHGEGAELWLPTFGSEGHLYMGILKPKARVGYQQENQGFWFDLVVHSLWSEECVRWDWNLGCGQRERNLCRDVLRLATLSIKLGYLMRPKGPEIQGRRYTWGSDGASSALKSHLCITIALTLYYHKN